MKYSIVVPVYNIEKYLKKCIESVLDQSYMEWELLLVDDGSQDKSAVICDLFAGKDERIIVIHKKNSGAADARNIGIGNASGDYILFLDGDDYWEDKEALEKINNRLIKKNADVLLVKRKKFFEKNGKYREIGKSLFEENETVSKEEFLIKVIKENAWKPAPWDKIVKRKVIVEKEIFFEKGMFAEDILWTCKVMLLADTFDYLPESFYVYRQREGSSSHTVTEKMINDIYMQIEEELSMANGLDTGMKNILYSFCAYDYAILLGYIFEMEKSVKKSYYTKLKKWKFLLDYDISDKVHKVRIMKKIVGFRGLPIVLNCYMKIKDRNV